MRTLAFVPGSVLGLWAFAAQAANTVIVYDASNSMWGQIDGEAKVVIARRVLKDIIGGWEAGAPLALVAYGHRRKGDCSDIETLVPVGPVNPKAMISRVEDLNPKGKTPLTAAIRHAAEAVKYQDAPANVVLISDGIETCNADPCAAASELNKAGINFTTHVIGFDVGDADQAQLRCIADNTGGRFFAARDAEGLKSALGEAAKIATVKVPEAEVTLTAPASAVAGSLVEVSWEGEKIQPRDMVTIVRADAGRDARGDYERVGRERSATLLAPGRPGPYQARYISSATGKSVASAPVELTEPRVSVAAPAQVAGGANVRVSWENAVHPRDYVTIVPSGAGARDHGDYIRVANETEGTLQAPSEPGEYEVRYLLMAGDRAVARTPLTVREQAVSISAPASVTGGANFSVQWDKVVHPRDFVTVVPAGAPKDARGAYLRVGDERSGTLQAPAGAGDYELRYVLEESGEAIARSPIKVTEATADVSGPASVTAGANFTVEWRRGIHPRDYVTIVPADAPADERGDYTRIGNATSGRLQAPAGAGDYELRYVLEESGEAIARSPIEVTEATARVSAPDEVTAGSRFSVGWTEAIHPRDYVTIVSADAAGDARGDYIRVGNGSEGVLTAPGEPGDYEVRYLLEVNGQALARAPIRLSPPEVTLSAPDKVAAGERFRVTWDNTIHPRDKIAIVPRGAPANADDNYRRAGSGTETTLEAPEKAGAYELRYLLNVNKQVIASTALTVE